MTAPAYRGPQESAGSSQAPNGPVVFLHIGEPKTGTTFLQGVLWNNRNELARAGIALAGHRQQDAFRAVQDIRGVPQAGNDPAGTWQGEWDILADQARRATGTVVISVEQMAAMTRRQAERAVRSLEPAEVHVVVTLRDFATLLPAEWQETIKHANRGGWQDWLTHIIERAGRDHRRSGCWFWEVHDTVAVLARWAPYVPAERIHVVSMPPRAKPAGLLWERFASVIGVDPGVADTSRTFPNASLGMAEVELLRRVNKALPVGLPMWFYVIEVKEELAHSVLAKRRGKAAVRLPAERLEWAEKEADRIINEVLAAGYDVVGDLDEIRPLPAAAGGTRPGDVAAEDMLDGAVELIATLVQRLYRDSQAPTATLPSLTVAQRKRVLRRAKSTVRRLSRDHRSVQLARVAYWKLAERARILRRPR